MTLLYEISLNTLTTIVVISWLEKLFKYFFEVYDCGYYRKFTDKNMVKSSMTIQWLIVSMIVSMFMGFTSLNKFFPILLNMSENMFDNDYDVYDSIDNISVFVGYIVHDLIFNKPSRTYIFHHVLCLLPIIIFSIYEYSKGMMVGEILLIAEISTIFLSMKTFMKYITGSEAKIVNIMFAVTFVIFRTLMIPYILGCIYFKMGSDILAMYTFISVFVLAILNIIWSYVICKKILSYNK